LDGGKIRRSSSQVIKGRTVPRQGWVSQEILDRQPAPVIQRTAKSRQADMLTVLVPTARHAKVSTAIEDLGDGAKVLTVTIDGRATQIKIGANGGLSAFKAQPR
jgi:mRNA-degrading endonuclease toxin of MazEF toxin-antitoxin module